MIVATINNIIIMKNWFKNLFGKKENTELFKEVREGNNINLYDQTMVEYLESELANPTQDEFIKLIEKSEKIIISKREVNKNKVIKTPITINGKITEIEGNPVENVKVLEITDTQELQAIQKHFEILNDSKGHLMCVGDYLFNFINKQGNSVEVEYLGFGYIRIEEKFKDDAALRRPLEFVNWLNSIGIPDPLDMWIEDENRRTENERRILEWKSVAPKSLIKSMDSINQNPYGQFDENVLNELKIEIPDEKELVLRLFKLYGTGFYDWNGVPAYETIPSSILMGINIGFLNTIAETEDLDKEHKEGIARFLSSWDFSQKRKSEIKNVSKGVMNNLMNHLEEMGNEEKIIQFKNSLNE